MFTRRASLFCAQRVASRAQVVATSITSRGKLVAVTGVAAATGTAAATQCAWFSTARPSWTLQYFPVPGAPGEICRVLLALSGDVWTDERIPGSKWGEVKPSTPYGQMPVLTSSDGKVLTQSRAIAHYLAKDVKVQGKALYPEDKYLAYQVDEYIEALEDVRAKVTKTFAIKDQKEKEKARAALFATDGSGEVVEAFKRIEGKIPAGGCMVGSSVTLADAWLFVVVNMFRAGWLDGVPSEGWMEQLPKLHACIAKVAALPALKAHYEKNADMVVMGTKVYANFLK